MPYSTELTVCVADIFARQAVHPYAVADLSTAEIVACIIIHKGTALDINTIYVEIMQNFPAFGATIAREAGTIRAAELKTGAEIMTVLRDYDFDFTRVTPIDPSTQTTYALDERNARFVLRRRLETSPPSFTDFPSLPPEIPLRIFETVLLLPASGIMVCRDAAQGPQVQPNGKKRYPKALILATNDPSVQFSMADMPRAVSANDPATYPGHPNAKTYTTPFAQHLNLLLVNKAANADCEKIFWGGNRFHAQRLEDWYKSMQELKLSRAKLLRKVSFGYDPSDQRYGGKVFDKLLRLGVKSARVDMLKKDWVGNGWLPRGSKKTKPAEVAGVSALCGLSEDAEIMVEGDWEDFALWVRANGKVKRVMYNGEEVEKAG